jgi:hypothetical protein
MGTHPRCPWIDSFRLAGLPAIAIATALAVLVTPLSASASSEIASRWTFLTWARFVDDQIASIDILAIQGVNGLLRFLRAAHGDESKSSRPLRHFIHHQHRFGYRPKLGEEFFQRSLSGLEREISYIEFHDCDMFLLWGPSPILRASAADGISLYYVPASKIAF